MGHSPQLLRRSELRARALRPAAIHAEKARLLVGEFRVGCRSDIFWDISVYWQMILIYFGIFGIYSVFFYLQMIMILYIWDIFGIYFGIYLYI